MSEKHYECSPFTILWMHEYHDFVESTKETSMPLQVSTIEYNRRAVGLHYVVVFYIKKQMGPHDGSFDWLLLHLALYSNIYRGTVVYKVD